MKLQRLQTSLMMAFGAIVAGMLESGMSVDEIRAAVNVAHASYKQSAAIADGLIDAGS